MQRPRFVDPSSPRGWPAEKRRSTFDQRWAVLWERTRARRILCGFLLGPNQRSPSPSLNGIVEAARKKGALEIHRMDTEMKAVILSHAQFQRREQPDAKLKRRAHRLKGTVCNQANMHGAPLAVHPPFRLPLANACRVAQPRRSSPAMARQEGLGLGPVPFRHDETRPSLLNASFSHFPRHFPP